VTRTLTAAARGLATCAAIVALASACSSSTSGSGSSGTGGGGGGTGGSSGGVSAPPTGGGGSTSSGSGGGGGGVASGNFCTDWQHVGDDLSKIISPTGIQQQFVARFDRLAAEAPADIKPAVVAVDQYVHNAVNGHADPQASTKLGQDFEQIGLWIVHNCH
jgi:hypothetical protein